MGSPQCQTSVMKRVLPLLLVAACSANDDIPAPLLGSVVPDHGVPGTIVLVTGNYFCQRPNTGIEDPACDSTGEVSFGASPGTISDWTDTAIMVEVPQGALGSVALSVIVNGRSSNPTSFDVQ